MLTSQALQHGYKKRRYHLNALHTVIKDANSEYAFKPSPVTQSGYDVTRGHDPACRLLSDLGGTSHAALPRDELHREWQSEYDSRTRSCVQASVRSRWHVTRCVATTRFELHRECQSEYDTRTRLCVQASVRPRRHVTRCVATTRFELHREWQSEYDTRTRSCVQASVRPRRHVTRCVATTRFELNREWQSEYDSRIRSCVQASVRHRRHVTRCVVTTRFELHREWQSEYDTRTRSCVQASVSLGGTSHAALHNETRYSPWQSDMTRGHDPASDFSQTGGTHTLRCYNET
ncbi:hypothetical protein J6590_066846 [Homalodisca vitripennis]|nr:hypothetical protein J6590_066846 [Homalodisca vitripennis]